MRSARRSERRSENLELECEFKLKCAKARCRVIPKVAFQRAGVKSTNFVPPTFVRVGLVSKSAIKLVYAVREIKTLASLRKVLTRSNLVAPDSILKGIECAYWRRNLF